MGLVPSLISWLQSTHSLTGALIIVLGSCATLVNGVSTLVGAIIKLIEQIKEKRTMKSTDGSVPTRAAVGRFIVRVLTNCGLWCSILLAGAGAWILMARAQVANTGSPVASSATSFSVDSHYAATGRWGMSTTLSSAAETKEERGLSTFRLAKGSMSGRTNTKTISRIKSPLSLPECIT